MKKGVLALFACVLPVSLIAQDDIDNTFGNPFEEKSNHFISEGPNANVTVGPDIGIPVSGNFELEKKHYLEKLYIDMVGAPNAVAERLQFDVNKLGDLYLFLLQIRQEDKRLGRAAISEMCRVWRQDVDSIPESERASLALAAHKSFETSPRNNKYIESAFANITNILGEEVSDALIQDLDLYTQRSRVKVIYFADLVHHVGREIDQMNLSCGD